MAYGVAVFTPDLEPQVSCSLVGRMCPCPVSRSFSFRTKNIEFRGHWVLGRGVATAAQHLVVAETQVGVLLLVVVQVVVAVA